MKKLYLSFILFLLVGCEVETSKLKEELQDARDSINVLYTLSLDLQTARDSIDVLQQKVVELSYPADQRYSNIILAIDREDYDLANKELSELVRVFPNSVEASKKDKLSATIAAGVESKLAEEKRLKALGFKALTETSKVNIEDVTLSFGTFKTGTQFTFDAYSTYGGHSEWRYIQADKNTKYVSSQLSITSTSPNPKLPECAVYIVDGSRLVYLRTFITKMARWDDYASYLGNNADYNNDFSKVNTVKFKVGVQIEDEVLKKPFVVVVKNQCSLSRNNNSLATPPISYTGYTSFKSYLTLDDVKSGEYIVVKKNNFNLL